MAERERESRQQGSGSKPDINTASREELRAVPSIGEELADRIIQRRPFRSEEDVDRLFQVGDERVQYIKQSLRIPSGRSSTRGEGSRTEPR